MVLERKSVEIEIGVGKQAGVGQLCDREERSLGLWGRTAHMDPHWENKTEEDSVKVPVRRKMVI